MLKALARVLTLVLAVLVTLLPLPAAPTKASEAEGGATMAAPVVFLLEQPARQVVAPLTSRKAITLVALLVALLFLTQPRFSGVSPGHFPAPPPKPRLYALGKLQLEGG